MKREIERLPTTAPASMPIRKGVEMIRAQGGVGRTASLVTLGAAR